MLAFITRFTPGPLTNMSKPFSWFTKIRKKSTHSHMPVPGTEHARPELRVLEVLGLMHK